MLDGDGDGEAPPAAEPLALCPSEALAERGTAFMFDVQQYGRPERAFALRIDGAPVAFLNRCVHVPVEMDWQPGEFLDSEREFIICSIHGAVYEPRHGHCAGGPCVIPAQGVAGREVTTLEGLPGRCSRSEVLHPVQQAFVDEQAAQCGYCLNGMVMVAVALLERNPDPDEAAVRRELSGNLCRCGTHVEIIRAVLRAARLMREAQA